MNPGRGSIQRASVGILDKHVTNRRSQGLPCAFAQQSTLARLLPKRSGRSAIEFADAHVQAITHGELQRLDLRTQHELFDEQVSTISLELAQEALQGLPNGRLYAQGLCVSLVGLLASRHARPAVVPLPTTTGRLGPLRWHRAPTGGASRLRRRRGCRRPRGGSRVRLPAARRKLLLV